MYETIDIERGVDLAVEEIYEWSKLSTEEQDMYLDVAIRVRAFSEIQFPDLLLVLGIMAFLSSLT